MTKRDQESASLGDKVNGTRLRLHRKGGALRTKVIQFRLTPDELLACITDAEKNDDVTMNAWARRKAGLVK